VARSSMDSRCPVTGASSDSEGENELIIRH
jgi:hypothetical protein